MKENSTLLATLFLALLLSPLFLVGAETVKAQTTQKDDLSSGLNISSPVNMTYISNSVLLNVTAKRSFNPDLYNSELRYSLDGKTNVTLQSTATFYDMTLPNGWFSSLASYTLIKGTAYLSNLAEGSHNITVWGIYSSTGGPLARLGPAVMYDSQTIDFMISDGVAPVTELLQFQNKTSQNSLPLNFSMDEPVSWIGYSLDGQANVTLSGNTTLSQLAYGSHSLAVYANDTAGNMGTTGNMNFTIMKPESFPVIPTAIVSLIVVAVVGAGLFIFFKKRRSVFNQGKNV